jgi:DNA replication protein DnaC
MQHTIQDLTPYKEIDGTRHYDFRRCCIALSYLGKQLYGPKFRLYNQDKEIIYKLLIYAIRDEENCRAYNIDLNKGILLMGPVGCGKTSLMHLLRSFFYRPYLYPIYTTRDIASEFHRDGYSVIRKYGKHPHHLCLDDLGVEQHMKHYGNTCNTIGEILLDRYDLLQREGLLTHATTNLDANKLEALYGNRVRSRLRGMFNLIAFPSAASDKRN